MPLPTVMLDDRRFQDIVDQAKTLIPRYCPEWTEHNVSDPGVALIELFAWMTDMLLYRVNQVPDKMYVKFLEMIGVRLEPPRAARAPLTFYLSAPQLTQVTIPEGTEAATIRTETSPAIVFTAETDLTIRPPELLGALTRNASRGDNDGWTRHDLRQLALAGNRIALFPQQPGVGDAFYLALRQDHGHHVLALVLDCEVAGGAGVDPRNPPLEWQVWQGGLTRWVTCEVEHDGTGGFNDAGEIILHLPAMAQGTFHQLNAYWLRCRLTEAQAGPKSYRVSPDVQNLRVEARGGTVNARHAETVLNEMVGRSDGTPGQTFTLLRTPLLARDLARDCLLVEPPGGETEQWHEVSDFADSHPEDHHFTLDNLDGVLTFGPALLQPDGSVYQFGATPPRGSLLRFQRYQHGGGAAGNVPVSVLSVVKSSIPYVARVTNRQAAVGGRDAQSLDDAKLRAPQVLRTRTRAVTADDYEYLACQLDGVARACCLAPGAQPGGPADLKPGQVVVVVLPQAGEVTGRISPERLTVSAELRTTVLAHLNARQLLGATVDVRAPHYLWVAVDAKLRVAERSDPELNATVQQRTEAELYRYLNPHVGGPQGHGWPFGRELHLSEVYALLQRVPAVEFVEDVRLQVRHADANGAAQTVATRLVLPPHGVVCSDRHRISVT